MSDYTSLRATIDANVKQNGNQEITGIVMNSVLNAMVNSLGAGYQYMGGAVPSMDPGTPDYNVFYLATRDGMYNYFDGIIVSDEIALLSYNGTWSKTSVHLAGGFTQIHNNIISSKPYLDILLGDDSLALRIDMSSIYAGGDDKKYIGSLIISILTDGSGVVNDVEAYYYGEDLSSLVSSIKIYHDADENETRLTIEADSSNDDIIFTIYPMDDNAFTASLASATTGTEVQSVTPTAMGGGDKRGVVSQTQTWSGTGSNPRTYVMSNQVYGLIPQAFIDLVTSAGASFNSVSGYFELNGLTDISYEEMLAIYDQSRQASARRWNRLFNYATCRTNLPFYWYGRVASNHMESNEMTNGFVNSQLEVFCMPPKVGSDIMQISNVSALFYGANYLKKIINPFKVSSGTIANTFSAPSLEEFQYHGISASTLFSLCSKMSKDSLLYMINNAGTATITITLHASVYAKCQSGGDWYADVSAALANHTNITLASA